MFVSFGISLHVWPPSVLTCHWTPFTCASIGLGSPSTSRKTLFDNSLSPFPAGLPAPPSAAAVNTAVCPLHTLWLVGSCVIDGGLPTVKVVVHVL